MILSTYGLLRDATSTIRDKELIETNLANPQSEVEGQTCKDT